MTLKASGLPAAAAAWALSPIVAIGALLVILAPLDLQQQMIFAVASVALVFLIDRWKSRRITLSLCIASGLISTRYIVWRAIYTLDDFHSIPDAVLSWCLFFTELYVWIILLLGYFQITWSLERKPAPITGRPEQWPMIDVFIPTYNEDLEIVRHTVFAAQAMDYPKDRFRVFILDDGRRPEFAQFSGLAGCGYLTRNDNRHAKAGNLNSALGRTSGDLVVVFDCDHVPTRAFLQLTVGWFQRDPRLALLQTPHYFYSPDPIERNLRLDRSVPGEGELFYGAVQKGNDFWNAAFFCGSCAVIRRTALAETGGFAHETVTEDAHTALKLQRKGWNTAYVQLRLAAGLATERLALHVGQRIRWARGMTQILRIDNPLFGPGLSLPQRLCYLNAMLHFQFAAPRIVFLTSPLAFLLFGQNVIHASAALIFAYAAPHLFLTMKTNDRLQGGERGVFWGEIYETLLAFHLLKPTLLTLIDPRRGKFNVTAKGGTLDRSYFDTVTLRPHLVTAALLILGLCVGLAKLPFALHDGAQAVTLLMNAAWTMFSLFILMGAISVGREAQQRRRQIRIPFDQPVTVHFDDGYVVDGTALDISYSGLALRLPDAILSSGPRKITDVEIASPDVSVALAARQIEAKDGLARLQFEALSLEQQRRLTTVIMGRADAWSDDARTLAAKAKWRSSLRGGLGILRAAGAAILGARPSRRRAGGLRAATASSTAAALAAVLLAGAVAGVSALPTPAAAEDAPRALDAAPARAEVSRMVVLASATPQGGGARTRRYAFRDLRVLSTIRLIGSQGEIGIPFGLRKDEVVTASTLNLTFSHSPSLLSDLSQLMVLVNGEVVKIMSLSAQNATVGTIRIPVNPSLFLPGDNQINIRLVGHYAKSCEDPQSSALWANVSNTQSWLDLSFQKTQTRDELSDLPAPFFDRHGEEPLVLPFVFVRQPADADLEAAATVASWFGALASYRGYAFKPYLDALPPGDAVVFVTPGRKPANLDVAIDGPGLAIMPNPADPSGRLLVVMGRTDEELKLAASALAGAASGLSGRKASVAGIQIPAFKAYEAPRWLPTNRPVQLSELIDPLKLVGRGLPPGPLTVRFQAAPDLFFWPKAGATLNTVYRYPASSWIDGPRSRLDLSLNGQFLQTLPLQGRTWISGLLGGGGQTSARNRAKATLPSYALFSQNEVLYYFDLLPAVRGGCPGQRPSEVRVAIEPQSTIDLRGAHHAAQLPDLSLFAAGGFPFTRYPDLGDTLAILSPSPTAPELETFLTLMGRFGDSTGVPAYRLTVARSYAPDSAAGKQILVVGTTAMTGLEPLFAGAPLGLADGRLTLEPQGLAAKAVRLLRADHLDDPSAINASLVSGESFAGMFSFRAPDGKGWVTAVMAARPEVLPNVAYAIQDPKLNSQIQGDVAVLGNEGFQSFRLSPRTWYGDLPPWLRVVYAASRHPVLLSVLCLVIAVLVGGLIYRIFTHREKSRLSAD